MKVALREQYKEKVVPELQKRHGYANVMAVPKLEKIVVNMGLGEAREDSKVLERAGRELAQITLQRPVVTKAKKSVSNFKVRAGMPVGLMVSLRGERMWVFLEKLINIACPACATFAASAPAASTAAATTAWGCASSWSSRSSPSTRSTACAAWTSPS